jgi:leucyl aminopeptidase
VLLVTGLGPASDVSVEVLRKAGGTAARQATKEPVLAVEVAADLLSSPDADVAEALTAAVEGCGLGAYSFTRYKSKAPEAPSVERVLFGAAGLGEDEADMAISTGAVLVRAASLARDLVNTPPQAKRPPDLADTAARIAGEHGLQVRVFDQGALEEGGFGGILGVGQGSSVEPRLVELTYVPEGAPGDGTLDHVVLIGKGITFDSGGISLKPSAAMVTMKSDMSGAAAVLGTMTTLAELGVTSRVTGLMALAENMPGGDAIRVSDVLVHRGGRTTEVLNTDAEGRLVLADALAYGVEQGPDVMIDLATLTGAQVVALGKSISGLMGTDDALMAELVDAGAEAGERMWQLPLPADYADQLKSEVADAKNIGKVGEAGTIIAGLFLKEFTDGLSWAHVDIAGPAFSEDGDGAYTTKGGTGVMVRTLARFLRNRSVAGA